MRSHQGAASYSSGVGGVRSCERLVKSFTKGEISGVKTTVGGMVVDRLRGLNDVDDDPVDRRQEDQRDDEDGGDGHAVERLFAGCLDGGHLSAPSPC